MLHSLYVEKKIAVNSFVDHAVPDKPALLYAVLWIMQCQTNQLYCMQFCGSCSARQTSLTVCSFVDHAVPDKPALLYAVLWIMQCQTNQPYCMQFLWIMQCQTNQPYCMQFCGSCSARQTSFTVCSSTEQRLSL
jgi:hypothetical protein